MRRLLAVLCAIAPAALAQPSGSPAARPFSVTLDAKAMHEECVRLEAGENRRFYWKSDAPVDFNIHYHREREVFYPVKRDAMRGDGGSFTAKTGEDYCWMWTARAKAARLEGKIEPK
ncbi:MAG: hypothetical protein ABI789_08840 [Usitatibacter sp.]